MGVISEAYIMRRLNEFARTDAGKAKIAQYRKELFEKGNGSPGVLTRERVQEILFKICEDFKSVVREVIASFRAEAIQAEMQGFYDDGRFRASISVDEDALRRESLHYIQSNLSISRGKGVDDILALFTHGYTITKKRPFGMWVHDGGNSMTRVGARMHRDPDPFLTTFVNRMNEEYAGKCVITLNNKYKAQGGG